MVWIMFSCLTGKYVPVVMIVQMVLLGFVRDSAASDFLKADVKKPWVYADKICKQNNSTLIKMTERTDLELTVQLLRDPKVIREREFKFWTIHRTSTLSTDISYEGFPNEDVDNISPDLVFCVFAIFYADEKRIGWFTDQCIAEKSFVCGGLGPPREDSPVNITLYSYKTNQGDANDICARNGQTLLEIEDELKKDAMLVHLKEEPWINKSVSTFWTVHRSEHEYSETTFQPFPVDTISDSTGGYCVFAVYNNKQQPQLGWETGDCGTEDHTFMCQKPIEGCYFRILRNQFSTLNEYSSEVNNVSKCERECKIVALQGTPCGGFNYRLSDNTCSYVEVDGVSVYYKSNTDYNFHVKDCTLRPLLDEKDWISSDGTTGDYEIPSSLFTMQHTSITIQSQIPSTESETLTTNDFETRSSLLTTTHTSDTISSQNPTSESNPQIPTSKRPKCNCKCKTSNKTIEEKIAEIVRDIKVDRKDTSAYRRKFTSAPDSRILSKGMGFTAGAILVSIGISVVLMDSHRITTSFRIILRGVRRFLLSMT